MKQDQGDALRDFSICGALEKQLLTYLLTYKITMSKSRPQSPQWVICEKLQQLILFLGPGAAVF